MPSRPVLLSSEEADCLEKILALASLKTGCDFKRYNRRTMLRRVRRRMIDTLSQSIGHYLDHLRNDPGEMGSLVSTLTIQVSEFFRDPAVYEIIASEVLPEIMERKLKRYDRNLRIWSAACACGEETFSLAMLVAESLTDLPVDEQPWSVTILGTDIDPAALTAAGRGVFADKTMESVPPSFQEKYFFQPTELVPDRWQVTPELSGMCAFVPFDLTNRTTLSPPGGVFAEYDLICCRNFFIYCQMSLKEEIINRLHRCLGPYGYLILGQAETLPSSLESWYTPIEHRLKIYRKKGEI